MKLLYNHLSDAGGPHRADAPHAGGIIWEERRRQPQVAAVGVSGGMRFSLFRVTVRCF
jgi:hypothetical protein